MKYSKAEVHRKTHGLPALRFEDCQLTSFSGLILLSWSSCRGPDRRCYRAVIPVRRSMRAVTSHPLPSRL
jgi:hypothetical protein